MMEHSLSQSSRTVQRGAAAALFLFVSLTLLPAFAKALEGAPKYKKYKPVERVQKLSKLLEITAYEDSASFTAFRPAGGEANAGNVSEDVTVTVLLERIADGEAGVRFKDGKIYVLDREIDPSLAVKITDSIFDDPDFREVNIIRVTLWTNDEAQRLTRLAPRERIAVGSNYEIPEGAFIHSSVITFGGDIIVAGEVNNSAISVGGNVRVGDNAVIRDHAISIGGSVEMAEEATVYGFVLPAGDHARPTRRRRPWVTDHQNLSFVPEFYYNRVDGFTPLIGWSFTDIDSALPEISFKFGISSSSERSRFNFDINQPLWKQHKVYLYGSAYRKLQSDDTYLLDRWKNTLFSLLARKDFLNYYETQGGEVGVTASPWRAATISVGAYTHRLQRVSASPTLWALFGGDNFPGNYQGLPASAVDSLSTELNDKRVSGFRLKAEAHSVKSFGKRPTTWSAEAELERAFDGLSSEYVFTRFTAQGQLNAPLTKYTSLLARLRGGVGSNDLPLHRHFFTGGYRWLRGYEHMEFFGDQFWTGAVDYGVDLRGVGLNSLVFWMFYDIGSVSDNDFSANYYHSVGLGLGLSESLRLNIALRLDRSSADPRISVEF